MKKIISMFLAVVMLVLFLCPASAFAYEPSYGVYKHVFIIGIDGAGGFIKNTDTPNFDRIFGSGAISYNARAEVRTNSADNWASMLTGVSFLKHGINNDNIGDVEITSESEYPTVFTYVREALPEAQLASFVNWNSINVGIIETDIGIVKDNYPDDERLTDMICDYLNDGNSPALMFVQFDSVDHEGHATNCNSEEYLNQISVVDGYLGRIYDTVASNGMLEDSLFIAVSDHGHLRQYGGHGGITMDESMTTLAVSGKTVITGSEMDNDVRNRDVAAIALYALGIEKPSYMTSRIPGNLFLGVKGEIRPVFKDPLDWMLSNLSWIITSMTDNEIGFTIYAEVYKAGAKIINSFS